MLSILITSCFILASSPFEFEIDSGPALELKAGSGISDSHDDASLMTGARAGFSFVKQADYAIGLELDFTHHTYYVDPPAASKQRKYKYYGEANLSFTEFYNPMAFRFALGGGLERRESKYSATADYRFGLGYYFTKQWALFGDSVGRYIFRKNDGSSSLELSLSLQHIF